MGPFYTSVNSCARLFPQFVLPCLILDQVYLCIIPVDRLSSRNTSICTAGKSPSRPAMPLWHSLGWWKHGFNVAWGVYLHTPFRNQQRGLSLDDVSRWTPDVSARNSDSRSIPFPSRSLIRPAPHKTGPDVHIRLFSSPTASSWDKSKGKEEPNRREDSFFRS